MDAIWVRGSSTPCENGKSRQHEQNTKKELTLVGNKARTEVAIEQQ